MMWGGPARAAPRLLLRRRSSRKMAPPLPPLPATHSRRHGRAAARVEMKRNGARQNAGREDKKCNVGRATMLYQLSRANEKERKKKRKKRTEEGRKPGLRTRTHARAHTPTLAEVGRLFAHSPHSLPERRQCKGLRTLIIRGGGAGIDPSYPLAQFLQCSDHPHVGIVGHTQCALIRVALSFSVDPIDFSRDKPSSLRMNYPLLEAAACCILTRHLGGLPTRTTTGTELKGEYFRTSRVIGRGAPVEVDGFGENIPGRQVTAAGRLGRAKPVENTVATGGRPRSRRRGGTACTVSHASRVSSVLPAEPDKPLPTRPSLVSLATRRVSVHYFRGKLNRHAEYSVLIRSESSSDISHYCVCTFPDRWIDRAGNIKWPARSPDLTSLDLYLWGKLKQQVYDEVPTTREDMKDRITRTCCLAADVQCVVMVLKHCDCIHLAQRFLEETRKFPLQTPRICRGDCIDNLLNRNPCPETYRCRATIVSNKSTSASRDGTRRLPCLEPHSRAFVSSINMVEYTFAEYTDMNLSAWHS
ncbi:hypothetical protein PR048_011581 [Dryococelus australis]|uniref:Uncharacterized protein n=1 Tax=Dryococelus australis TaxID=614101 RepID=A0ABQ9HML0_9NEOP|nr:hypothetical protein PR048_011581 [Dryococelus australis]